MEFKTVSVEKPSEINFILGQSHFIKTVEDIYELIVSTNPNMKFGVAFCEASGPALVRYIGNDPELIGMAKKNALNIGCGHSFIIFMESGFPINILNGIKNLSEVCTIFCATANQVDVVIAENETGRGIMGIIDGVKPAGIESDEDIMKRKSFLRNIGYKL